MKPDKDVKGNEFPQEVAIIAVTQYGNALIVHAIPVKAEGREK
jgi:hypothetical protein